MASGSYWLVRPRNEWRSVRQPRMGKLNIAVVMSFLTGVSAKGNLVIFAFVHIITGSAVLGPCVLVEHYNVINKFVEVFHASYIGPRCLSVSGFGSKGNCPHQH